MIRRLLPLLFLALSAVAADPPKAKAPGKGTNYAFLVGCAGYNPKVLAPIQADATVNDVIEFKKALVATGFKDDHIVLMHDKQWEKAGAGPSFVPERAKIVKKLDLSLAGLTPDDTVVVALSGHGVHFKGDKTGYFCPIDADLSDKQSLLPFDGDGGLYTKLEKCRAGRKLLIANTCRDAPAVPGADLAGPKIELTDEYLEVVPKGIAALYSCEPGQRSYYDPKRARSYFFLHLTDAWVQGGSLESVFDVTRAKTMDEVKRAEERKQFPVVKRKYDGDWVIVGPIRWPGEEEYRKGYSLNYGAGAKIDLKEALAWYRKAAEKGHPLGQMELASFLRAGMHTEKNESEAAKLERSALPQIREAAEREILAAQAWFGAMYLQGVGGLTKDEAEAVKWFRKAADQGFATAQYHLGDMHFTGLGGLTKDEAEAVKWVRKAADQGHAPGQTALGVFYARGLGGLTKDEAEAVKWFRKAADQNWIEAQIHLGQIYASGEGVKRDLDEGIRWYLKAAELNSSEAQDRLGWLYHHGEGMKHDQGEAMKWFMKAANQGNASAQYGVGHVYNCKNGVKPDFAAAFRWHKMAAEQNQAEAQTSLAEMYELGQGVPINLNEAVKWYRRAVEHGDPTTKQYAADALKRLGK